MPRARSTSDNCRISPTITHLLLVLFVYLYFCLVALSKAFEKFPSFSESAVFKEDSFRTLRQLRRTTVEGFVQYRLSK